MNTLLNSITVCGSHPLSRSDFLDKAMQLPLDYFEELVTDYLLYEEVLIIAELIEAQILSDDRQYDMITLLTRAAATAVAIDKDIAKNEGELRKIKKTTTEPKEKFLKFMRERRAGLRDSVKTAFLLSGDKRACGWKLVQQETPTFILPEEGTSDYDVLALAFMHTSMVKLTIKPSEFQKYMRENPELAREFGIQAELRSHVALESDE